MNYNAIFFDRDNTLTCKKAEVAKWEKELIEGWSGKEYKLDYEKRMYLFDRAGYPKDGLKSVEKEIEFWRKFYIRLLQEEGIKEKLEERSEIIFNKVWLNDRDIFPEVIEVLNYFKAGGFKIGVISDTSPSLPLTLESLGLGKYFDSYTCSDLVGVMKPDKKIYKTALDSLNVTAEESLYVDDYDVEADGARDMGFTSFHIVRSGELKTEWDIKSLKDIVKYVEDSR